VSREKEQAEIQATMNKFQAIWNQKVQPHLDRNPRVPAQFIIDTNTIVAGQLAPPVLELAKVGAVGKVTSLAIRFAGIGVGGGVEIPAQVTDQVEAAAKNESDTLLFLMGSVLTPLTNEAKRAIAVQGKKATVQIVTSGPDRLDRVIVGAFNSAREAWKRLDQIQSLADSSLLFRLIQNQLESALAMARAIEELARFLAALGKAIYNTVVGVGKFVSLAIKLALIGGVAFVGYKIYEGQRRQRQLPAATSNPRSRSRPRRRQRQRRLA